MRGMVSESFITNMEGYTHVSAQRDLVVGQAALGVDVPERAHPVDDEAVVFDRSLEALQAVP